MNARTTPRGAFGMTVIALAMTAVLVSLGIWQLQRRVWKHELIAALAERIAAAPQDLPASSDWAGLNPAHDEFRRVRFTATLLMKPDAMVYTLGSAIRTDVAGPGTWAFVPAKLAEGGTIIVNEGFVPNTMQDRARQDRAIVPLQTGQPVSMTGYLRFPEKPGLLTARGDAAKRLWFVRDTDGMARELGWGAIAPFYIDLESPMPPSGIPKPGPLKVHLKDDHLQYAITWFGLALAVAVSFGFWLFGRLRPGT
ncbi:MAG: SURF1 family protein [Xanthobacteraceae bacterium]|nr:SURF1 family protein [Xanthobacteraceae bacterium]